MDFSMNTEGMNTGGMNTEGMSDGKSSLFSEMGKKFLENNTDNQNENQQDHTNQEQPPAVAKSGDLRGRLVGLNLDPMEAKSDENLKNSSKIKANWDCYWNSKNTRDAAKKNAVGHKSAKPEKPVNEYYNKKEEYRAKSDENLKNVNPDIDILDDYSKIDAYAYKYNKKAHDLYGNQKGIDDELHVGPMAQDLEKTNSTKASVSEDPNGYKEVDIRKLTLSNTAAISELVRKIEALEKMVGGK